MIHIENVLVYDIPPIVAAIGAVAAAKIGKKNHDKLVSIDKAVNGVTDPAQGSLKENVQALRDDMEQSKK